MQIGVVPEMIVGDFSFRSRLREIYYPYIRNTLESKVRA